MRTNSGVGKAALSRELLRGEHLIAEEAPDATKFSEHVLFADGLVR
jgi:hypothetical protein